MHWKKMKIGIKCTEPNCGKYIDIDIGSGRNYIDIDYLAEREGMYLIRISHSEICFPACCEDCRDKIIEVLEAIYD